MGTTPNPGSDPLRRNDVAILRLLAGMLANEAAGLRAVADTRADPESALPPAPWEEVEAGSDSCP
jgi:hypothetical protein